MITESIKIEHLETSFIKRVKYYILLYLLLIFVFGLIAIQKSDNNKKALFVFVIISVIFAIAYLFKILKTKTYIVDFYSDSNKVFVRYFEGLKEKTIESDLKDIKTKLKNVSSRAGFNCELQVKIENLNFLINTDFDWDFREIKNLFEYIQYHKNIALTEQEKSTISRIEHKLKKT